jgi:hypothetical protein
MNILVLVVAIVLVVSGAVFLATTLSARAVRLTREASGQSWSVEEIVKALTSISALITGAILPLFTALQGLKSADALRAELIALRDSNRTLIRFEPRTWAKLPPLTPVVDSGPMRVDDRDAKTKCDSAKRVFSYDATGPAKLHCLKGSFQVQLSAPTVLLFVPDSAKPQ